MSTPTGKRKVLSFSGGGKISVSVNDIVNSPKVQRQVNIVREIAMSTPTPTEQMSTPTPLSLLEPTCWRREWDGDVSDLGQFVYADSRDELDEYGPWEPLYSEPDVRQLQTRIVDLEAALQAASLDSQRKGEALRELVRLDDLKDTFATLLANADEHGYSISYQRATYEYDNAIEAAWIAARAALSKEAGQ